MKLKNGKMRWIIRSLLCIFVLFTMLGASSYKAYAMDDDVLSQAKGIIEKYYVDEIPESKIDSAKNMDELLKLLNDPYSQFFSSKGFQDFTDSINNRVCGIGVQIEMVPEGVNVMAVFKDSPAMDAGIKVGDIIVESDGHSLAGLTTAQSASYIKGDEGTLASIKVKRGNDSYTYNILRKEIVAPTVEGKMLQSGAAYISIGTFGESTRNEFKDVLDKLKDEKPTGYIVDIRNNPGGYLMTAREIGEFFIGAEPIVTLKDREGSYKLKPVISDAKMFNRPVILLVNGNSASASEILAAAVKDYKKAFIVGSKSFGKGTVQSPFILKDGSILKLTVQRFYSPFGNPINKVGVQPDLDSGDEDPLLISELLLGNKKGGIEINVSGRKFAMDAEKAAMPENWMAAKRIIEQAISSGTLSVNSADGRINAVSSNAEDLWRIFFPGYDKAASLKDVPCDRKFSIKTDKHVDTQSIGSNDIFLVNVASGSRVPLDFKNAADGEIEIKPSQNLEAGATYYLVVSDSFEGASKPTVTIVDVKK